MTYIQLIQQCTLTLVIVIPSLNPIFPLPHASFLTYQIRVDLKTGVSNKLNKRHLATTLTWLAAYSANHKRSLSKQSGVAELVLTFTIKLAAGPLTHTIRYDTIICNAHSVCQLAESEARDAWLTSKSTRLKLPAIWWQYIRLQLAIDI